jgi:hypothetical protein
MPVRVRKGAYWHARMKQPNARAHSNAYSNTRDTHLNARIISACTCSDLRACIWLNVHVLTAHSTLPLVYSIYFYMCILVWCSIHVFKYALYTRNAQQAHAHLDANAEIIAKCVLRVCQYTYAKASTITNPENVLFLYMYVTCTNK